MERGCISCDERLPPRARFCLNCGLAVAAEAKDVQTGRRAVADYTPKYLADKILRSRSAVQGERKQVTVLFCDVVDSTRLASALGAEAMHALLSNFFTIALAEVHRFEGTVNQFLGDGFMAIFGAPIAYEDHAARAGLAALAIRHAIERARTAASLPGWTDLHVRMGLNSGQVVVGAIGDDLRMDYTAVGNTTNLAARLQSVAAPDEILCGDTTVTAARDTLTVQALAPVSLKGISEPAGRHLLTSAREHTNRPERRVTRFVGRADELAELTTYVDLLRQKRGGVVEIEGEAGVGKSRLLLEFKVTLSADLHIAEGQCITYGYQRPNVPIAELIRGLSERRSTAYEAQNIDAPVQAIRVDDSHEPDYLAALRGDAKAQAQVGEMDPATVRGRTVEALVEHVLRCASRAPTILVIEDLHWADPSTLAFLTAVANAIPGTRCLLIVTFRTGFNPPWSVSARRARLVISPLPHEESVALLDNFPEASGLSAIRQQDLLARAEGNPFFLGELVRAMADGDVELSGDVYDVLSARVDQLDAENKANLRMAAVIGREFSLDLLEEVAATRSDKRLHLEKMVSLGFVEPTTVPRRFQFVHALTQEVVYKTILGDERRHLHAAVAVVLSEKALRAEDLCEEIAHHLLESDDEQNALPFLETATAKAIRNHNLDAAHGFLVDAMRLFEAQMMTQQRLVRCVTFLLQAFPIFHFLHRHKEYADLLERYAPAVEALDMPALLGPFLSQRGHRQWVSGWRCGEVTATLVRALALCAEADDPVNGAHAAVMLTWSHANAGLYAQAEDYSEEALRLLERAPVPWLQTFAHVGLLLCAVYRGQWSAALEQGRRARDVGIAANDDGMAAFGGAFIAFSLHESGDSRGAIAAGQDALGVAPTDYFRGWALAFIAAATCRTRLDAEALGTLQYAVRLAQAAGHSGYTTIALLLVEALLRAGDYGPAEIEAEALRAQALSMPYPFVAGSALMALAEIKLHAGDPHDALKTFQEARTELEAIDSAHRVAQARAGAGRSLILLGDLATARAELLAAHSAFSRLKSLTAAEEVHRILDSLC